MTLPLVAVTGAAGRVGRLTVKALAGRCRLRLVDREWPAEPSDDPLTPAVDDAERIAVDLRNADVWPAVLDSADVVVHLAGQPSPEIDTREAVEDVAMPTAHLVAAAGQSAVRRVVYASSIHAMGLYQRDARHPIDPRWPPRPCCEYGSAKVFCENLLGLLAVRSPVSVISLRLGLTGLLPTNAFRSSHWLGDDDFERLLRGALATTVDVGAYFGTSAGGTSFWDLSPGETDLGFVPAQHPPSLVHPEPEPASRCLMHR